MFFGALDGLNSLRKPVGSVSTNFHRNWSGGQEVMKYFRKRKKSELGFPNFSPLDAGIPQFGPEIRILREISSSEPDSQVWNRISSLKNLKRYVLTCFFVNSMSGLMVEKS